MNCYYSNLIEGHDTHPVDIERALKNDYSAERGKAQPPTRSQSAHRGPEMDRRGRTARTHGKRGRYLRDPWTVSANSCRMNCYGSKTLTMANECRLFPARFVNVMSESGNT